MHETDPLGKDAHTPGAKLDAGKPLPWLVISEFGNAIQEVVDIGTFGAKKYTPRGWVEVPDGTERYMEAFGRHMMQLATGEVYDKQTALSHKAHMIWNLLASLELEIRAAKAAAG